MKRVVLTGGPCGGKTTAMNFITEKLSDYSWTVGCVPEVATLSMVNSGFSQEIFSQMPRGKYLRFEERLIIGQMTLERHFSKLLALHDIRKKILIMDRGCMDAKVYTTDDEFDMLLRRHKWNVVDLRDRRYDAVFHLSSVADGRPELYTKENNPARRESTEEALVTDARTKEAWIGHSHLRVINNSTLFAEKIHRLLKEIQRALGMPKILEIERKFLLSEHFSIQRIPVPYQRISIEQAYLKKEEVRSRQRIRCRGQNDAYVYYLTEKTPSAESNFVQEEKEKRISSNEYYKLLEQRDPKRAIIKKERICFLWKNQYFELDLFTEPDWIRGLMILEIELTEENDKIKIPEWLGRVREVTNEPNYKNSELAKQPPK